MCRHFIFKYNMYSVRVEGMAPVIPAIVTTANLNSHHHLCILFYPRQTDTNSICDHCALNVW